MWAQIQSAHGARLLGPSSPLASGGAAWLSASAWSPDGRALALARGSRFAPLATRALDLAGAAARPLCDACVAGGVSFSADGAQVVVAETRGAHPLGRLPAALSTPFAVLADRILDRGEAFRGTRLRVGLRDAAPAPLVLPELEAWGAPTGVALSADGVRIYLGQRAPDARERLVEITRRCR